MSNKLTQKLYFVRARFGKLGDAWVERDPDVRPGWDALIADMAAGEWTDPQQVIEVDLQAGTSCDVTVAATEAALRKIAA